MSRLTLTATYHNSLTKRFFDLLCSVFVLVLFFPVIIIISAVIVITSREPVFFIQKRVGLNGKPYETIMFRTMYVGAERDQKKFAHLNEADGPVFKIRDDPRFVGIGKYLARTGLDELPQLINVIKGEMSLVGPRPLPVNEAKRLTKAQKVRELVKPGMTSPWVISGAHNLKFSQWMELDRQYVEKASFLTDTEILLKTVAKVPRLILEQIKNE